MKARKGASKYTYNVGWSDEDGVYVAWVEEFKFLAAHGPTRSQALAEIKSVVRLVIADLQVHGQPVPPPGGHLLNKKDLGTE